MTITIGNEGTLISKNNILATKRCCTAVVKLFFMKYEYGNCAADGKAKCIMH